MNLKKHRFGRMVTRRNYYVSQCGGIAQLVERLNGIQKVLGSTPCTSIFLLNSTGYKSLAFRF